ncbi:MAG: hypothetical protein QF436_02990 [Candidatus Woesearchaeota archaeon]|jgi:hypothetical protein|nr:hypothetical protein [Candidatus Woesearchaeota archaeon]MDP7623056.1 hypothetical protein [Candidatus Woesearchaeota archaeon]HJN56736.1 hypothetical protein [Candidatus Woesearchaeota archaeon]|tara:strand:- start:20318 stop:20548 length:231 start_codon:yes stop_codon:yes gene_type:complete
MTFIDQVPVLKKMLEMAYTIALVVLISGIVGLVLAFPVMWLWNFVFGNFHQISVLQAWALNVLAGILFGNKTNGKR